MSDVGTRGHKTDMTERFVTTRNIIGKATSQTVSSHKLIELFGSDGVSIPAFLKRIGHVEMTGTAGRPSIVRVIGMDRNMVETVELADGACIGIETGSIAE
jgi:hypothetical protein